MAILYQSGKVRTFHDKVDHYVIRPVISGTISFDDFIAHLAKHRSPYSRGVIQGVLTDMLECLQELLLDGKSVKFGELGTFLLGVKSHMADKEADVTPALVKSVKLRLINTKSWSNAELTKGCTFREQKGYTPIDRTGQTGKEETPEASTTAPDPAGD